MRGDGTENNPFIPETLTEFIYAIGASGAYVALTQDINAADDPEYTGYLGSAITFNAAELQGNGHTVRGITVDAKNFMTNGGQRLPVLRNLDLLDCAHKGTGSTFSYSGANEWYVLRSVRMSLKRDYVEGASNVIFERIDTGPVSADVTFTGGPWGGSPIVMNSGLNKFTLRVSGMISQGQMSVISNSSYFPVARTAMIFDGCRFGSAVIPSGTSYASVYAAFRGCSFDGAINCEASGSGSIIAIDDDSVAVNLSSGWSRATIEQMKDKDWLTSVGFLP